jgi:hypothetical protein
MAVFAELFAFLAPRFAQSNRILAVSTPFLAGRNEVRLVTWQRVGIDV